MMEPRYQIDLEKFRLNIQNREMIPSRLILKDDINIRFGILIDYGITNLKELTDQLKTKVGIGKFSEQTGLPQDYLTLLNREARSFLSNPVPLAKFPDVQASYLEGLSKIGIKNTRQLFNQAYSRDLRESMSETTGIPLPALNELVCLSDLSRAYGVGPVFARMIYDLGIKSIKEFIDHTPEEFILLYEKQTGKKADFGVNEIQFSIELAQELDNDCQV